MEPVRLWHGKKPSGSDLEKRVRRALGITRAAGYRMVKDPWGRWVKVELWRVIDHIANHQTDASRWQLIPAIVPSIKRARERGTVGTRLTYETSLPVATGRGQQYERLVFTTAVVFRQGEQAFDSILAPTLEKGIARARKRAGLSTRPNPIARTRALDSAGRRRTVNSLQGATSDPHRKHTTKRGAVSRLAGSGL